MEQMTELLKAMQVMVETQIGSLASRMDTHEAKTDANQEMLAELEAKKDANQKNGRTAWELLS
jgi:fructose/tagatose bisphosphate aldolase